MEAAAPAPLIDTDRNARADSDRADLNIAIEDRPAFGAGVFRSAAGEGGHGPLKRGWRRSANYQSLAYRNVARSFRELVASKILSAQQKSPSLGQGFSFLSRGGQYFMNREIF
jgi:hypothetical protein